MARGEATPRARSLRMAGYWLFKEEPTHYSFASLLRDGRTEWEGVKNPLARQHLGRVRRGDGILFYHTGKEKAVVGIMRAVSDARPDPASAGGKGVAVTVAAERALPRPVPLATLRAEPAFRKHPLVRLPRLSVMPLTSGEWERILALAKG